MGITPFRQLIRQGQSGSDITAVKRTLQTMHVQGSGAMIVRGTHRAYAGGSFTGCIRTVQRNHKLRQDGVYGKQTHELVAKHFGSYENWLYRRAKIRDPKPPPLAPDVAAAAKRLLALHAAGKYHDDRGTELAQITLASQGKPVWSPLGHYVLLDPQVLRALVWLIDNKGYRIGTFALCSDHGPDSAKGHAGGHAVDISSIDGVSINSADVKPKLLAVLKALRTAPGDLRPWQLISGGYAHHRDPDCTAQSMPAADAYYGAATMLQHTDHAHLGYQ